MSPDYTLSLARVLKSEGGWSNDPRDPGGPTMDGVTQHQYDLWRIAHQQPTQSVRLIAQVELATFYRSWYWTPICGDSLPAGVDYMVFDCAVNSGPRRASIILQQSVGVVPDGQIGAHTLSAVASMRPKDIISEFTLKHIEFLRTLSGYAHDGRGWSARCASVQANADMMA